MIRPRWLLPAALFIVACNDPGSGSDAGPSTETGESGDGDGDPGDGDGDPGDGDGDPGDGDGDPGDGDGDEPEPIPDGLFALVPGLDDTLALGPDDVFVTSRPSFFDDATVLRISKSDATAESFAVFGSSLGTMASTGEFLYGTNASEVLRAAFDPGSSFSAIASIGGVGGLKQLAFTNTQLFSLFLGQTDFVHRMGLDGAGAAGLLSGDIQQIRANSTRLYGVVADNLVEIDPQTGELTPILDAVGSFHVGETALYIRVGDSLQTTSLDGGAPVEFVSVDEVGGNASYYASDDQHLYWTTSSASSPTSVRRTPLAGGGVEVLADFPQGRSPVELRLDDSHAYWLITNEDEPAVWRVTK